MERKPILGLGIDTGSRAWFVERIAALAAERRSAFVCLANVHMTIEAHRHPDFGGDLRSADLVAPDGMPLVHALKWLHGLEQERVAGFDLLQALLRTADTQRLSVFIYGETEPILARLEKRIRQEFPQIRFAGAISPPFRSLSAEEEQDHLAAINASGAHLVLVALGCPRQEKWMARQKGQVHGVMLGLGAALGVFAGVNKRAPGWMQRHSLEWLYRLMQEPRRLAGRYLVSNSLFLVLVGRHILANRFRRRDAP